MWEIQPDWVALKSFYVSINSKRYQISRNEDNLSTQDPNIHLEQIGQRSFTITAPEGQCSFIAPKKILKIHNNESINCVDISPATNEILSGDRKGHLYLTFLGTEPVPIIGPSEDFDVEDCLFDPAHKLFFSCGGDFRIYEYSATEYEKTNQFVGHKSSVKHLEVVDNLLYSGGYDSNIIKWDIQTKKRISTFSDNGQINDFCFTNTGILISATENQLRGIDVKSGLPAPAPNMGRPGESVAVNSVATNGNDVVCGTQDGEVYVWDIRNTDTPAAMWKWYDSPINKVRYANGKLWSASNDGTMASIDIREKKSFIILGTQAYAPVNDFAFNDTNVWTADGEGGLYNFDV